MKLDILREGKTLSLPVVIEKLARRAPGAGGSGRSPAAAPPRSASSSRIWTTSCASSSACATSKGVVVEDVEPGGPAADAGVRPGDLLVEVDRKPVADAAEAESRLAAAGESVLLLVRRGDGTIYLVLNKKS